MGVPTPDFSGWATKANLKCSDGRTIAPDAFKDQDTTKVPLVWQHAHGEPTNVLGHALLENRPEGVYCHGYFNETPTGQSTRLLVEHGDVVALSIYANQLIEKSKNVVHGKIREVSLVLAGANPGAFIESVNIRHADDGEIEELDGVAIISPMIELDVIHAETNVDDETKEEVASEESTEDAPKQSEEDEKEEANVADVEHADTKKTLKDVFDTLNEEQKSVVYFMLTEALKKPSARDNDPVAHSAIQKTMSELNEEQENVVTYMLGEALERAAVAHADSNDDEDTTHSAATADTNAAAHADTQEGTTMTNLFEKGTTQSQDNSQALSHDELKSLVQTAEKRKTTFKAVLEEHALAHGITDIGVLFPDAKLVTTTPEFLARRNAWVAEVITGTRHTPFAKIKNLFADLTVEEARAKGYVKGALKREEFFKVAGRSTGPTTIYKKQKLERDDILDITDFDVVAWLKGEMRLMLEEEIARAVLLGDGRDVADPDKVDEDCIRPIATDHELYQTTVTVDLGDTSSSAEELVDAVVLNRNAYRGSGNPVLFTSETTLSRLLLIKDSLGRRIYPTVNDLASAMRVSKIETVEVMDEPEYDVLAILVNLADYTIGANRGGDIALFDDFDIDYNAQKYLIETRMSGALTKLKSAIVLRRPAVTTP